MRFLRSASACLLLLAAAGSVTVAVGDAPDWQVNPAAFEHNGSVTSAVFVGAAQQGAGDDLLAAFVGDECRGVVQALETPFGDYLFLLMVYGNEASGDVLSFRYYDSGADETALVQETIEFVPNMTECALMAPCQLHLLVNSMPAAPANPTPANGAQAVSVATQLCWLGGDPDPTDDMMYHIYLDTSAPPSFVETTELYPGSETSICFDPPGALDENTLYYWLIVAEDEHGGTMPGETWTFRTGDTPVEESSWGMVKALYRP